MTNSAPLGDLPGLGVLARIGTDGRTRQVRVRHVARVQDDAGIERQQAVRGGQQRVDVQLGDGRLLDDQLAEADHELLEGSHVDAATAAHALEGRVDLGALHHAARQRRGQRWQPQRTVLEDLHQLAAQAEEQDGTELRVHAAADDELVAVTSDHGLHGDALEVAWPVLGGDGLLDARIGITDRVSVGQVQAHAAHVRLVRDGV